LKGLSLIAQINFQRTATSLKTPKFFRNVANAFFPLGDKKTQLPNRHFPISN